MEIVHTVEELRARVAIWRHHSDRIALVPTMGNLHEGHLQLVDHARAQAERVVTSIFVNPTQFGPNEDYARYPRTLDDDAALLEKREANLVFAPDVNEMYPTGVEHSTIVEVPALSDILCGANRPGHFRGVTSVVARLFHMVQPDIAVFGEKDFQQLLVIRRMVRDLSMSIDVQGVPTAREESGLALSSRNRYLGPAEREIAPMLHRCIAEVAAALAGGNTDYAGLEQAACKRLSDAGLQPDYVAIRRAGDLGPPGKPHAELRVLAAAWLGEARLIDNLPVPAA